MPAHHIDTHAPDVLDHPAPKYTSPEGMALRLGVSRTTAYGILRSGAIESRRHGRRRLIRITDIDAFVASLPSEPPGAERATG
jgi:excisionase family DNA binding protein